MFKGDNATAEVKRLVYEAGKANGKTTIGNYRGYLTEINISEIADPKMYGKVFHFNTEYGANIQSSDDLIIDGVKYSVQSVLNKKGCTLSFTRCVILLDA